MRGARTSAASIAAVFAVLLMATRVSWGAAAGSANVGPVTPSAEGPIEDVLARATPGVRVFDDKDGLPQNTISSQTMDPDGRLWIGTQEGLAVYDGVAFRRVPLPDERRSEWITALAVLPDGSVAIGTHADGVWVWSRSGFSHPTSGLLDEGVRALAFRPLASGGELWVGTRKGVARKRGDQWQRVEGDPFAEKMVSWIAPHAPSGDVWIGSEAGLAKLAGGIWTTWHAGDSGLPTDASGQVLPDEDGHGAWASFRGGGLAHFDGIRWDAREMPCDDVLPLARTGGGAEAATLWAGTNCSGLIGLQSGHRTLLDKKTSDLPSDFVVTLGRGRRLRPRHARAGLGHRPPLSPAADQRGVERQGHRGGPLHALGPAPEGRAFHPLHRGMRALRAGRHGRCAPPCWRRA